MTTLTDFLFDQETVERNYREYVFHQGEARGMKIATLNNIKSLLKINVDPATIMQAFNISEAELEAMRQEIFNIGK